MRHSNCATLHSKLLGLLSTVGSDFFIFVYVVDICLHALLCLMLNMKKIKLQRMHWIHLLH